MSPSKPLTVTALTRQLKDAIETQFATIAVIGEITELSQPQSGHLYFTLKDKHAQIRAVAWRSTVEALEFDIQSGQQVVCQGHLDVYPPRGSYQLVATRIESVGVGDWQQRLKLLQKKLAREGCFDPQRKRPLPAFARHIVVVTSPTGAAVRDFLEVARRRWQNVRITIAPVKVQGERAGIQIGHAVRRLQELRPAPDVIVIARGGGSIEDLWCFNDEFLVRAVARSEIPVVSAVGHEVDVTLCDLAADVRALTPSEAAELVLPSADDVSRRLGQLQQRLSSAIRNRLQLARGKLAQLQSRRVLRRPLDLLLARQQRMDELRSRAARAMQQRLSAARQRLSHGAARLEAVSPLNVLARGYSLAKDEHGRLVASAAQLSTGQPLLIQFRDGRASTVVSEIQVDAAEGPGRSARGNLSDE
ncbi:MAG: exodeoxyribonuclease VII large subunit [Planctomycetales bacterium]|nr:exodeoxyribonuclease VII large subunit [Planctomycetales bacterium]